MSPSAQALVNKIQALTPERIAEVEGFVQFIRLRERERSFVRAASAAGEAAFAAIWDNQEDAAYDALKVRTYRPGPVSLYQPNRFKEARYRHQ